MDVPDTINVTEPDKAITLTLLICAVRVIPPCTVTDAAGTPLRTMLLAAEEMVEPLSSVIDAAMAFVELPSLKLSDVVVTDAPDVVITFVPESGPTIETPYPPDVMVEDKRFSDDPVTEPT